MLAEVGIGRGYLVSNVESLLGNQQLCSVLVSHCVLDAKVVAPPPGDTQIGRVPR